MRAKFIVGLPLLLLLSGCMNSGRDFDASVAQKSIVDGKTTKAEVIQMLGNPQSKSQNPQTGEMWNYQFYHGGALTPVGVFGSHGTKSAMIFFDGDIVKSHTTSQTETD